MTDKPSAADRRVDMMIRLALLDIAEDKWKQIEELDASDVVLSGRHIDRMHKLFEKGVPAVRRKKTAKNILLVALVALSAVAMLGMTIQPVRQAFTHAVVTWYKDFFQVEMQTNDYDYPQTIESLKEPVLLAHWNKVVQNESNLSRSVIYTDENGDIVYYVQRVLRASTVINIDETWFIKESEVHGYPAMLYIKLDSGNNVLQWNDENYCYILDSEITEDALQKIAESIY